jgi:hypothetical protein
MANGEWSVRRPHSPFATHHFASYRPCATFLNEEKIIMTRFDISKREIIGFLTLADGRASRRIRKPHGWETAEKPRSPASEPAMNCAQTGELVRS